MRNTNHTTVSKHNRISGITLVILACLASLMSARILAQGLFYSPEEIAFWQKRVQQGPFLHNGDAWAGSPGDWDRIMKNADGFVISPEPALTKANDYSNTAIRSIGLKARDAAFTYLVTGEQKYGDAVRNWLMLIVSDPSNDITQLPAVYATLPDGSRNTLDAYFNHAMGVARLAMIYDFARNSFSDIQRAQVETWFLNAGLYFEKYLHSGGLNAGDYGYGNAGLVANFPNRKIDDYQTRRNFAALDATNPDIWGKMSNLFYIALADPMVRYINNVPTITLDKDYTITDAGHGCGYFTGPLTGSYSYVRGDGVLGPRISRLSEYYNNRRSMTTTAFGLIGVLVNNQILVDEAKRYVKEWVRYSVWPDGSQGEYLRNGNYCGANAGVIYGAHNAQTAVLLAEVLARRGDFELYQYSTVWGLYGTGVSETETSVPPASPMKTILDAVGTHLLLVDGKLDWYLYEGFRTQQSPRAITHLDGITEFSQWGAYHTYHELSYLPANRYYGSSLVRGVILRDPPEAHPPFPGTDGLHVDGGLESWNGATSLFPGILFMYADSFADLSINLTATPDPVLLGGNIQYTATITNNALGAASSVTVGGIPGCTLPSSTIPSGGIATCDVFVAANSVGTATRTVSVSGAEVDTNTSNNSTTVSTQVIAPDLIPTAMSVSKAGSRVYVSDTVTNQGNGPAGAFSVSYYLSTDTTFESGTDLPLVTTSGGLTACTHSVTSLSPGAGSSSPAGMYCYKPGNTVSGRRYYVLAVDDVSNQVIESNEVNNVRATTGTVKW
jgi:hypothetical protein